MDYICVRAPAKINLFFEAVKKRKDNYHEIATLFAKIAITDKVTIKLLNNTNRIFFELINADNFKLAKGKNNLVVKAARLFKKKFGIKKGFKITLKKNIPTGAGLGGGSSDAAAVLKGLCRLFNVSPKKIKMLGKKLGADVSFFINDNVFCEGKGIGDKLMPVKPSGRLPYVVIVYPGVFISTKSVYDKLKLGSRKEVLTNLSRLHKLKIALIKGYAVSKWRALLYNRLETEVLVSNRRIKQVQKELISLGADAVLMSGSGSCIFALVNTKHKADLLAASSMKAGRFVRSTCFLRRWGYAGN